MPMQPDQLGQPEAQAANRQRRAAAPDSRNNEATAASVPRADDGTGSAAPDRPLPFCGQIARPGGAAGLAGEPMTTLPPPIRVTGGSAMASRDASDAGGSGGGGGGTPQARQTPTAASPSAAAGMYGGLLSPRSPHVASPRHRFDLEQHMAAVDAVLPLSPTRSTAARTAVARAAACGTVPCAAVGDLNAGGAGNVMDEEELEDIMEECISRGALT